MNRYVLAAASFAVSGAFSGWLWLHLASNANESSLWLYSVGLPFGVVAAAWCTGWKITAPIVAIFDVVAWGAAFWTANLLLGGSSTPYLGLCAAGLVGGLGVAISASIGCQGLRSARIIITTGLIGAVAAIPFAIGTKGEGADMMFLMLDFAIWQIATGIYLFAMYRRGG